MQYQGTNQFCLPQLAMLDKSDNHQCLRYHQHNPTTDSMAISMQLLVTEGFITKKQKTNHLSEPKQLQLFHCTFQNAMATTDHRESALNGQTSSNEVALSENYGFTSLTMLTLPCCLIGKGRPFKMVNQQTSLTSSSFAMVGCWVGGSIFSHETETMILLQQLLFSIIKVQSHTINPAFADFVEANLAPDSEEISLALTPDSGNLFGHSFRWSTSVFHKSFKLFQSFQFYLTFFSFYG